MPRASRPSRISRRDFARTLGVTATAALLPRATHGVHAAEPPKPSPPPPSPPPPPPSKLPPASQAEADARVQAIVGRYGSRLSPTDRADLTRLSRDAQSQLDTLRGYPLDTSDEPAHIFRAPRRRH